MSLKTKLTLLYTLLMTAVVCGILILLFLLGNRQIISSVQSRLRESVYSATEEIECEDGRLDFDSDLSELKSGVYLSVYDSSGTYLYGQVPRDFSNTAVFEDGRVRTVAEGGVSYSIFDVYTSIPGYGGVYIRGIISVSEVEEGVHVLQNMALIFLPLLVALTAILGYFMTKRTLRPVSVMTETVTQICRDRDLSKRIGLGKGNDEIYRLARTFDNLLDEIEEGFKREQQFTSDVSHELRTPISAMMLQCETLLAGQSLDRDTREGVEFLHQKVSYLSSMISQLLLLSRADQGREQMVMEAVNLSELMEMILLEGTEMAQSRYIQVKGDIVPDLYVWGDETLLIRMVMNLMENAVKYGKDYGHIYIRLWQEEKMIHGSVQDDGIGISKEDLPHIWERFYQADASRSADTSSGLGLSMVAWIVAAHKGQITAQSTLGEGTCFSFVLPIMY